MPPVGEDDRTAAAAADRLVFFEYCVSLILVSLRRPSRLYRLRAGEAGWVRGLPYVALSLVLGWWSIPWGLIYTPLTLWTNLTGGRVLTAAERERAGLA